MADQQTEMNEPTLQSAPTEGFGAVLKRTREAQGISLGDMAARSRLSVQQLRAIEDERMDELPEPVYVRAFLRGIAQSLEIDPTPLLADYAARFGSTEVGVLPDHDPSTEIVVHSKQRRLGFNLGLVVLMVAALGAGVWAYLNDEPNAPVQPVENATMAALAESKPATEGTESDAQKADATPVDTVATPEAKPAEAPATTTTVPATTTEATVAQSVTPPAKVVEAPKDVQKSTDQLVAKANHRRFVLRTTEACWVQIKMPNGKNLFAKEMRANDVANLEVPVGSKVTVGNASVLTVTVDGQPFELKKVTRNGICRFDVK